MAALLSVELATKRFGGLVANKDVSLTIEPGEIVGLIGPNGAGKTTLFNCITGYMHPDEGRIIVDGTDVSSTRPERICGLGVARTWQVVRAFGRIRKDQIDHVGVPAAAGSFARSAEVARGGAGGEW